MGTYVLGKEIVLKGLLTDVSQVPGKEETQEENVDWTSIGLWCKLKSLHLIIKSLDLLSHLVGAAWSIQGPGKNAMVNPKETS